MCLEKRRNGERRFWWKQIYPIDKTSTQSELRRIFHRKLKWTLSFGISLFQEQHSARFEERRSSHIRTAMLHTLRKLLIELDQIRRLTPRSYLCQVNSGDGLQNLILAIDASVRSPDFWLFDRVVRNVMFVKISYEKKYNTVRKNHCHRHCKIVRDTDCLRSAHIY